MESPGIPGRFSGRVLDVQNAVIPGSAVTLINNATRAERATLSDDTGRYLFLQVAPGTYEVRVEQAGFRTASILDVRLQVDTPATLDLILEIGQITEVVTVAGDLELLNQTNAATGNAFQPEQIVNLPLESRNVVQLLTVQPGVTREGYTSGTRSDQANITLDGIDVNEQQRGGFVAPGEDADELGEFDAFASVLRVTPDSVQEFRVTTSNPSASQGRSSGAQISLVTKSGTNDFHGSFYEFHRNTSTTANDFFNNRVEGDPDLDGEPGIARPRLIRNLFGGSIGGPIGQDKAFFFFNYEGRRDRSQSTDIREVPLPHLGQGEVRYTNTSGQLVALGAGDLAQMYPDIGGVNPVALEVLAAAASRYPKNDSGVGDGVNIGGFRFNGSTPLNQNTFVAKLDFNLTARQQLYLRGNYQWSHPFGIATGHTWTISPTLVNTARYGLTRQSFSQQGDSAQNEIIFRDVYEPRLHTRTLNRTTPLHNFTNDTAWVRGDHALQFGTNLRFINNERASFANSFDAAIMNPSFYDLSGGVLDEVLDDLADGSRDIFRNAATSVLGRYSEFSGRFLFGNDGSLLPSGSPALRDFATEEYEFYFEDTWQVRSDLTLNLGLRWGVNTPVNESGGFQVTPTTSLSGFFDRRVAGAAQGNPLNELISLDVAGPFYGRPGFYDTDWNNFGPRIAAAWSPSFEDGILRTIFGGEGESVIRGGFSVMYDRIGSQLAVSFDLNNSLGYVQQLETGANTFDVSDNPGPLFTGLNQEVRPLLPSADLTIPDSLVFPLTHPADEVQRIESSLDDGLTTPFNYNWNLSIGRELPNGLFVEVSYLGRAARDLLATRDIMHLNNLVDSQSGMSWYEATRILSGHRETQTPIEQVTPVAYFENLFPEFAGAFGLGATATQEVYGLMSDDGFGLANDWTFAQLLIDDDGIFPNMFFHPQWAALSAFSTLASSDYHAMTFSVRERLRDSLSFDFNYTWSKSMDNASGLQASSQYDSAFILNPLDLDISRSISDFDTQHIINSNWLWSLPVGRGRSYLSDMPAAADAALGGWSLNGVFRWNSGLPQETPFEASRWATNWNVSNWGARIRDPGSNPSRGGRSPQCFCRSGVCLPELPRNLRGRGGRPERVSTSGFFHP